MKISLTWWIVALLAVGNTGCSENQNKTALEPARNKAGQEPAPSPLVELSPRAVEAFKQALQSQNQTGSFYLRLEAKWQGEGNCCLHKLWIEPQPPTPEDHTFESSGIKVVVPKRQIEMLRGARVDYGQKGAHTGFMVANPNLEGSGLEKWGPVLRAEAASE